MESEKSTHGDRHLLPVELRRHGCWHQLKKLSRMLYGMDAVLCSILVWVSASTMGANVNSTNFSVTAQDPAFAKQVAEAAEIYRKELAIAWTGKEMPRWSSRCPIQVKAGHLGASGATTFQFDRGEVYGWRMEVQGTEERILDSVLPHEINHTVFACYFRRPLPRWADEGAASLIEHESERGRLKKIHEQVMSTNKKIPLKKLLAMKDYPSDQQQVLTLYAEGYSLADFLIQQSDRRKYLQFLSQAFADGWERALRDQYGYERIDLLEKELEQWILAGSPDLNTPEGSLLADRRRGTSREVPTIRGQSPEWHVVLGEPGDWPRRSSANEEKSSPEESSAPLFTASTTKAPRSRTTLQQPVAVIASSVPDERRSRTGLVHPSLELAR